jgi:hypothetical protein
MDGEVAHETTILLTLPFAMLVTKRLASSSKRVFACLSKHVLLLTVVGFVKGDICETILPVAIEEGVPGMFSACGSASQVTCTCNQDSDYGQATCVNSRVFCALGVCGKMTRGVSLTSSGEWTIVNFVDYTSGLSGSISSTVGRIGPTYKGQGCIQDIVTCQDGSSAYTYDCTNIQVGLFLNYCDPPYLGVLSNDPNNVFFGLYLPALDKCDIPSQATTVPSQATTASSQATIVQSRGLFLSGFFTTWLLVWGTDVLQLQLQL